MSRIPDNKKLILVNIPGSHDSAAYDMHSCGSIFAKTQYYSILDQLKIGGRIFDIRITTDKSGQHRTIEEDVMNDTDLICCHGICNCHYTENKIRRILTFKDVLNQMRYFLSEHPTETIILRTQSGRGKKHINVRRSLEVAQKLIGDISAEYNEKYTMGDVRGKIIYTTFLTDTKNEQGFPVYKSRLDTSTSIIPTHYNFTNNYPKFEEYKVWGQLKVKEIKELINNYEFTFEEAERLNNQRRGFILPLNYETSCTGEFYRCLPLPKYEAKIVNQYLIEHNFKPGYYYGWISVDFLEERITQRIINSNFVV